MYKARDKVRAVKSAYVLGSGVEGQEARAIQRVTMSLSCPRTAWPRSL